MSKPEAITMPTQPLWRSHRRLLTWHKSNATLLNGSMIMLLGTALVSLINFGYNVVVAQMLGPAQFGHTSAAVTLLMLASAITLSFQLVCAKFVARNEGAAARSAVYGRLMSRAWVVGIGLALLMLLSSGIISNYLRMPTRWIVIALACGIAVYVPLGVKRGGMQGSCTFPKLAWNFVLESSVKFAGAVAVIFLVKDYTPVGPWVERVLGPAAASNAAVIGAVAAISLAIFAAYFVPRTNRELRSQPGDCVPANAREGMQATIFFVGQVIINNIDILLVKHYFPPREAGLYAAVALVGRVLYFASWSLVSTMFPISAAAATRQERQKSLSVLVFPLLCVLGMAVAFIVGLDVFAPTVIRIVFGSGFQEAQPLLSLYAAATGAYALSVVLMAFEMSRKIANTGWLQLLFSGLVVIGIGMFHGSLRQVIVVQIVLMGLLFAAVSLPFFRRPRSIAELEEAA